MTAEGDAAAPSRAPALGAVHIHPTLPFLILVGFGQLNRIRHGLRTMVPSRRNV